MWIGNRARASYSAGFVSHPLESLRRLPAVGVLAEQKMGGFLALSALVGVGVGVGTAGLVWSLEGVRFLIGPLLDQGPAPWIFLTVPAGLLAAWWVARAVAPEVAGDGVPEAAAALAVHGGRMRARVIPLKTLATALTLGSGGSAGREGPIVQIGGAIGSWVSTRFGLGEDQVRSLVAAGAGAAIGASFNAPIAGMLFALEVILVSFAPRHISAIVIASVTAAVTSRRLVGEELSIGAASYEMNSPSELWLYGLLALVVVVFGYLFIRLLDWAETTGSRFPSWTRPVAAGLAVAALIFLEPNLFGTGQEVTNSLLLQEQVTALTGSGGEVWWVLGLLAVGKALATSLTIASGASGGAFMPSLFMGAVVGTGLARLLQPVWAGPELMPGAFAVVGMAAMFAVVARAPLTSILIVFEITGARDYDLILPLMLAATLGTFLAERFLPGSVYTQALRRRGITLRRTGDVDLLDTITVGEVMVPASFVATPDQSLADVEALLHTHRSHGVPVVDDGVLVGMVTISDLGRTLERLEDACVGDVMTHRPVSVTPATPVSEALERMVALGVGRLPVVTEEDPTTLAGMFRREEAVRAYHEALGTTTDTELTRLRLAQRTDPGAGYHQFRIPPGSIADGRRIRDVAWPEGTTLVSIRREREVMIPTGDSALQAGDVVTAFGTPGSHQRVIARLNAGAEEPTAEIFLGDAEQTGSEGEQSPGSGPESVG
jgi:CIC family chloride channel protein